MASDEDYLPPEKKRKDVVPKETTGVTTDPGQTGCVICNGSRGQLKESEKNRTVTSKGIETLRTVFLKSNDEASCRLKRLKKEDLNKIKFHESCRATYIRNRQTLATAQEEVPVPQEEKREEGTYVLRSTVTPFLWQNHCVICGEGGTTKNPLSTTTKDPVSFRETLENAAMTRTDGEMILHRLRSIAGNLCKYHRRCHKVYIGAKNIASKAQPLHVMTTQCTQQEEAFATLTDELQIQLFNERKVIYLKNACSRYDVLFHADDETSSTRSFWLKKKLQDHYGAKIIFYGQPGSPTVFCAHDLAIGSFLESVDITYISDDKTDNRTDFQTEFQYLHRVAGILRAEIEAIEATKHYPGVQDVRLEESEKFIPPMLRYLLQALLDKDAYQSGQNGHSSSKRIRQWYTAISECIIYCARRGEQQVIPPLHIGLVLQMHHQFGSKDLINALHGHGFCATYDELRLFLSAAAEKEIENQAKEFIPPGIVPRSKGGRLIQEGDDNIDINTHTIDGKGTYHSMARVIFQQTEGNENQQSSVNIDRTTVSHALNRSLKVDEQTKNNLTRTIPYLKPQKRPQPARHKDPMKLLSELAQHPIILPRDLAWMLVRQLPRSQVDTYSPHLQITPMWTGFNSNIASSDERYTMASYAPTIEAPPTDMATVYTTLKKGQQLTKKIGQKHQIHTFDQQLYAIAQQIKWSNKEEFGDLVNRLGGFHAMCSYIGCIGKLWGDGGLKDILVDSGVYAPSTADQMLKGHQFHRAIRGLTMCFEVLLNRFVNAFIDWFQQSAHVNILEQLEQLVRRVYTNMEKDGGILLGPMSHLEEFLESEVLPLMMNFSKEMSEQSPTFRYWFSCLNALQVMLLNIRAEREGNWMLHLQTFLSMMPYFFSCNHHNYARWGTSYILDMVADLPADVKAAFMEGDFSVRRTPGCFNGIWSDLGVETTVIKDSKGHGSGIIGKTHQESTSLRWCLTNLLLGKYTKEMRDRTSSGLVASDDYHEQQHSQNQPAKMKEDETHVTRMVQHVTENMTDPFFSEEHPQELVNIGSGLVATTEVQQSLLSARSDGKQAFQRFVTERFSNGKEKSFWDAIPKSRLKTFTDMNKTTPIKIRGGHIDVAISAEQAFRRALAISERRDDVSVATVLQRPISSVPTVFFKGDATRRKTNKAELLHWVETKVPAAHQRPESAKYVTAYVIDAMAEVQAMNGDLYKTFNDMGQAFLDRVAAYFTYSPQVHVVFDRYDKEDSVKLEERIIRCGSGYKGHTYEILGGRVIPKWRKFVSVLSNKAALTHFFCDYVCDNLVLQDADQAASGRAMYIAGGFRDGRTSVCITADGQTEVEDLETNQEEADTRMFLHLAVIDGMCVNQGTKCRVIVKSPDTDVVVLAVHFFPELSAIDELWVEMVTKTKTTNLHRFLPIHTMCATLGTTMCSILPALHALTGCDTVSSIQGFGKKTVMNVISRRNGEPHENLKNLGSRAMQDALPAARKLLFHLYLGKKAMAFEDLNSLRVHLALKEKRSVGSLPPCEVVFYYHVQRAAWQTRVWMTATQRDADVGSPVGHGWYRAEQVVCLQPVFFDGPTAIEVLEDFVCRCKGRKKCAKDCTCYDIGCIDLCSCEGGEKCYNPRQEPIDEDD